MAITRGEISLGVWKARFKGRLFSLFLKDRLNVPNTTTNGNLLK